MPGELAAHLTGEVKPTGQRIVSRLMESAQAIQLNYGDLRLAKERRAA